MLLPNITKLVISYVEGNNKDLEKGILLLAIILLLKFSQNLAESHLFYHFALLGYNVSNGLSMCIFSKALKYPTLSSKEFQLSELINYSQVDAQRMTFLGFYTSAIIFFPIQLGVGIYLMYSFIGISFLAGIGIILLMGLFILVNSKLNAKANEKLLAAKDKRMKATTEIFNLIRFIKVNAWEKYFFKKLNRARN
jgi:ABC-type bacteriocin/lantibiotic exporter with double-glycine peptidase domain